MAVAQELQYQLQGQEALEVEEMEELDQVVERKMQIQEQQILAVAAVE